MTVLIMKFWTSVEAGAMDTLAWVLWDVPFTHVSPISLSLTL